ncbi:head-tail connector protein [Enterococcus avium]|uniref:head-tail connector protein n=1 Tax=Enterococcus TaxID=1350 RepID=UPI00288EC691|nr:MULTISPECIES: head-tail connector protein [Enterococcus]MDT2438254.1 head-tail connector protein [Enterococcus avium]MDT2451078.1 head-tail connector protein [Enterococcus avium]MDT2467857.1 head-tail connector protein [Enterococcus avium]MDT2507227.1 head-tail connector protein [Enterococcus avium]MDT2525807.1 head-tail connector protein [Enterococcus raffinosus]
MELSELKNYLRIDHDLDDALIGTLQDIAEKYIYGAIEVTATDDKRFDYAVTLLVAHWYENRISTTEKALDEIPFGVTALIHQLRGLDRGTDSNE